MERSEWGQPAEPAPRWRALLDRALLGRSGEHQQVPRARAGQQGGASATVDERRTGYPDHLPDEHPGYYPDERPGPRREQYQAPPRPGVPPGQYAPQPQPAVHPGQFHQPGQYPNQLDPGQIEWRQAARPDDSTGWAIATLRRELAGPKVLAFANPKGGVHKTTATALAAATIGSVRGRGVIAWDDNELRGTLGLRAGSARHARTIRHLITDLAEVEATSGLELADKVDDYLRHASDGTYDVLAGEENPRFAQHLDQYTVRRVLELLRRTHDVICVDTGNNVESTNWRTVLQAADQLVVTTVPREDAAFTADWMLDLLDESGMGHLVAGAVTLLSCASPTPQPLLEDLQAHFATRTRAVAVVPYDPALESGSSIEPAMLQPATRQAWLQAAATLIDPLTR
ncbi:ATPase [Natronosporangium hydrolyticum]|uniref:ATPase n=1 Tax=Natronosporangium hydrolyticum TaxID=2811111 RepID=A0A895YLJ5_9ACTN|nr:AAA family ATPase [Natronosporangium hydrolyticum]QSB16359.1 ATPase [Natronosporangium hydrolyticum]